MNKPLPSLALDMSKDGIALHQLAFDGHWHELARVELSDAALRERLSNMRTVATRLEGRRFKTRVWLPAEQIISKNLRLAGNDAAARKNQARADFAAQAGGKPGAFSIQVGAKNDDGTYAVAGVRVRTLQEARTFAKSHGFRARGYGTQAPVNGFATPPVFAIPADKVKLAGLGLLAASAAALVLGGSYAFYKLDPLDMWEISPTAADFAPFQRPNPSIARANAPFQPAALSPRPNFTDIAAISTASAPYPLPYLPPRQLTAVALEQITQPRPPATDTAPALMPAPVVVAVNWPATIAPLATVDKADSPPALGLISVMDRIVDLAPPVADTPPTLPADPARGFKAPPRPITVANTAFFLEPLPAMASRLSPAALAEFAARSGLTITQLSTMARPLLLLESKLVTATRGLPPIMPRLRSGRAIPPQVTPLPQVVEPVSSGPAPLFTLVSGRPDILPAKRPAPAPAPEPAVATGEAGPPFNLVSGAPDIRPNFRPALPDSPESPATGTATPDDITASIALSNAVDAAIAAAIPPQNSVFSLLNGQPALLPLLRSGARIPPQVAASAPVQDVVQDVVQGISLATAEANALRPRRRAFDPQAPATPIDPMISGAAPVVAAHPPHRNAAFTANVARIIAASASRPRTTAPTVPRDPQTVNLPTSASVARAATIENALNLRKTNLLGIFGTADNRTALIMLSGGRMVRVTRGQSFSGWTVVAISESTVRIRKRNREEILRMPAE